MSKNPKPSEVSRSKIRSEVKASGRIRLMSRFEVMELTGVSYPTLWDWQRNGKFPRSREVNGETRWLASEVEDWIVNRPVKKLKGDPPVENPPTKWTSS